MLKAFDNAYSESTREFENQAEQKRAAHIKKSEEEIEIAKEQERIKMDFHNWKKNKIDEQLSLLEPLEVESLKTEFTERITENSLFLKILQTKGFEHPVIQIERYKYLESKVLAKNDTDFEKFKDKISKEGKPTA